MKVNVSAQLYIPIVLTSQEIETNTLTITNDGDTPIEFQPKSSSNKAFTGIDLEIPYGNNDSDLVLKEHVKNISIVSKTKDIDVIKIKDVTLNSSGKVAWRIYPLKNVVLEPQEPIIIKLCSVKTNNSAGTVKIPMCICSDDDRKLFYAGLKKNDPPKIIKFSVETVKQITNEFISLETVADEKNECFVQLVYAAPPLPKKKNFQVEWECKNSFSCKLSYGYLDENISSSGIKQLEIDEDIKTIKLTAFGENKVGVDEKEIPLKK